MQYKVIVRNIMRMDKKIQRFYLIYFVTFVFVISICVVTFLEKGIFTKIFGLIWVGAWLLIIMVPCLLDLPDAVNRKYKYVEGTGIDSEKSDFPWRVIMLENTGNLKINVWSKTPYDKMYIGVYYLKNTKFGIIKSKI